MRQNSNGRQVGLRLVDSQRCRRFCDEYQAPRLWYVFGYVGIYTRPNLLFYKEGMAERVGFEPTVGVNLRLISSQVHSTTLPPLRGRALYRVQGPFGMACYHRRHGF